jgi:hypothetical protein
MAGSTGLGRAVAHARRRIRLPPVPAACAGTRPPSRYGATSGPARPSIPDIKVEPRSGTTARWRSWAAPRHRHPAHRRRGVPVHVAADHATRLAWVELLADERRQSCAGFLARALRWIEDRGIRVEQVSIRPGRPAFR